MNQKTHLLSARKQTIAKHFSRACDYNRHAHIQHNICQVLQAQVIHQYPHTHSSDIITQHQRVLEIGAGQGLFTKELAQTMNTSEWHINELCTQNHQHLRHILPTAQFYFGDAEGLDFLPTYLDTGFDLITSANTVQWFDKPLNFIDDAIQYLKPNGQLLFNSFTPNNFLQIKKLTGQGLLYPSVEQWQQKLQQYQLIKAGVTIHRYDTMFDSPYHVLKHIQQTGVSVNTSNSFRWTTTALKDFERAYQQLFSHPSGQVVLTYEAIVIDVIK